MIKDILCGVAVADAIGNPLEFLPYVTDVDYTRAVSRQVLNVSDDTQMSLFCATALHKAQGLASVTKSLKDEYLNWLLTQETMVGNPIGDGLLEFKSLYLRESPGSTCLSSTRILKENGVVSNNSKGNGTVMRCAPIAYWASINSLSDECAVYLSREDALLTHKHPFAWQSSVLLTYLHKRLLKGECLSGIIESICDGSGKVSQYLLDTYIVTILENVLDNNLYDDMRGRFRAFVAEEAAILAIGSVLHTDDYMGAVKKAVCIKGDSDTVGAVAGALSVYAGRKPPQELVRRLNVLDAINYVSGLYV